MRQLIAFFYTYRVTFIFLLLQGLALLLVYQNNQYQRMVWGSSASQVTGRLTQMKSDFLSYLALREKNEELKIENALLRMKWEDLKRKYPVPLPDTNAAIAAYAFIPAKVIRSSVHLTNNYITIDKGETDGIKPGMALTTGRGVVGRVKSVSEHFATAYPIINPRFGLSVKPKNEAELFSVSWTGKNPEEADLLQVSRGTRLQEGDTIVTSGQDAIFPEGLPVGIVRKIDRESSSGFLQVRLDLAVDFRRLSYVYAIRNEQRAERDSLEQSSFPTPTR